MITSFLRAPVLGENSILTVTWSKSRAERFPAHLKLKLFKAAVTRVGSRPERSSHTHRPRVHWAQEHLGGGWSDQRCWSRPLGTAIRTQHEKVVIWKGLGKKRRKKQHQDPLKEESKLWKNWKGTSINYKHPVGRKRFPGFHPKGRQAREGCWRGQPGKLKTLFKKHVREGVRRRNLAPSFTLSTPSFSFNWCGWNFALCDKSRVINETLSASKSQVGNKGLLGAKGQLKET